MTVTEFPQWGRHPPAVCHLSACRKFDHQIDLRRLRGHQRLCQSAFLLLCTRYHSSVLTLVLFARHLDDYRLAPCAHRVLISGWNRHLLMGAPIKKLQQLASWALVLPLVSFQLDLLEHGRLPHKKCEQAMYSFQLPRLNSRFSKTIGC